MNEKSTAQCKPTLKPLLEYSETPLMENQLLGKYAVHDFSAVARKQKTQTIHIVFYVCTIGLVYNCQCLHFAASFLNNVVL